MFFIILKILVWWRCSFLGSNLLFKYINQQCQHFGYAYIMVVYAWDIYCCFRSGRLRQKSSLFTVETNITQVGCLLCSLTSNNTVLSYKLIIHTSSQISLSWKALIRELPPRWNRNIWRWRYGLCGNLLQRLPYMQWGHDTRQCWWSMLCSVHYL